MNEKVVIKISLSVDEINKILDALGNQPFNQVFQLTSKIQQQAAAQLNGQTEED